MFKKIYLVMACLLVFVLPSGLALAVTPDEKLADPVMEQRARDISTGLRCLVCQNQSIDDSKAPLAKDLRILVRERLTKGDSNSEVMDFVVARYGDFVLLNPPFNIKTMMLWFAPLLILLAGIFMIKQFNTDAKARMKAEEREDSPAKTKLSDEEQARLDELLKE